MFRRQDRKIPPARYETEMEAAEELTPDPFSEEPHTIVHKKRMKSKENSQNHLNPHDN